MDKGRDEMNVKLYYQRESLGRERGGKNFQGNGRGWNHIDKFSLRNENLSRDNHGQNNGTSDQRGKDEQREGKLR